MTRQNEAGMASQEDESVFDVSDESAYEVPEQWSVEEIGDRGLKLFAQITRHYRGKLGREMWRRVIEAQGTLEGIKEHSITIGSERLAETVGYLIDRWPGEREPLLLYNLLDEMATTGITTPCQPLALQLRDRRVNSLTR